MNEVKCVALGEDVVDEIEAAPEPEPQTLEDELRALKKQFEHLVNAYDSLFAMVKEMSDGIDGAKAAEREKVIKEQKEKQAIPEGTILTGTSKGLSYFLHVKEGAFYVGITRFDSLSAAAEAVSGNRRSGWTFWKLPDGRSVKEVYKA